MIEKLQSPQRFVSSSSSSDPGPVLSQLPRLVIVAATNIGEKLRPGAGGGGHQYCSLGPGRHPALHWSLDIVTVGLGAETGCI